MANPVLNDKVFREMREADRPGWAAPTAPPAPSGPTAATDAPPVWHPPIDDGPVTQWKPYEAMTISGAVSAAGVLFVVLLVTGVIGWNLVDQPSPGVVEFPGWLFLPLLGGLGLAIFTAFKPRLAPFTSPVYAAAQGLVLGAISRVYSVEYEGIVVQAVGLTALVVGAMLALYALRVIRVTDRMRRTIMGATLGLVLFYGASLLLRLFDVDMPFIWDAGPFGILFSLFVVGLAAFNLTLDFDIIERGAEAGAPKFMEWYAAFGLMVTVVWLYLEILRLLAKLRER